MKVSELKALLAKVPGDAEIEVHLDMLDDEDPIVGTVRSASLTLSADKDSVMVIDAVDAHPDEGEEEEEEQSDEDEGEEEE